VGSQLDRKSSHNSYTGSRKSNKCAVEYRGLNTVMQNPSNKNISENNNGGSFTKSKMSASQIRANKSNS